MQTVQTITEVVRCWKEITVIKCTKQKKQQQWKQIIWKISVIQKNDDYFSTEIYENMHGAPIIIIIIN